MRFNRSLLPVAIALVWLTLPMKAAEPPALYLTWQRDPTRTMTVHWHTLGPDVSALEFRPLQGSTWQSALGTQRPFPQTTRIIHTVELAGLQPHTDYEFRFASNGPAYRFRTMPAQLDQPVRFVVGGDVYHRREWMDTMNELAGKLDPAFVAWGGDLAYSCGGTNLTENMTRWFMLFDSWKAKARTPDGRLIPLLVTMGNHEVIGSYRQPKSRAEGFYSLFAMPGEAGYASVDFGRYLSVLLLDSEHTTRIAGAQTAWLKRTLAERRRVPHVFPIYHLPAYPSYRKETEGDNARHIPSLRTNWVSLFEKHGVRMAFEHHDHAFKRTHPLRAGKVDERGIVYLGDGAWGVELRQPDPEQPRWYIARSGAIRHLFLVTLYPEARHVLALNEKGEVFDEVYQRVK